MLPLGLKRGNQGKTIKQVLFYGFRVEHLPIFSFCYHVLIHTWTVCQDGALFTESFAASKWNLKTSNGANNLYFSTFSN